MFVRIFVLSCLCSLLISPSKASSPWDFVNKETKHQLMGTLSKMCESVIDSPDWLNNVPIDKRLGETAPIHYSVLYADLLPDFINIALLQKDALEKCTWENVEHFFMTEHQKLYGTDNSQLNKFSVNVFISLLINLKFITLAGKPTNYLITQNTALSKALNLFNSKKTIQPEAILNKDNFATPEKPLKRIKVSKNKQIITS